MTPLVPGVTADTEPFVAQVDSGTGSADATAEKTQRGIEPTISATAARPTLRQRWYERCGRSERSAAAELTEPPAWSSRTSETMRVLAGRVIPPPYVLPVRNTSGARP